MRNKQKQETREKIIHTAKSLIETKGYDSTTIRQIAQSANIASGTIFVHFKNKEELFYTAFYDDLQGLIDQSLAQLTTNQTLQVQLLSIVTCFFQSFAERPDLYHCFLERSLLADGVWGDKFKTQTEAIAYKIAALYEQARTKGEIVSEIHIPTAVLSFFSFYYFLLIQATKERFSQVDLQLQQFSALIHQHLQGLTPQGEIL